MLTRGLHAEQATAAAVLSSGGCTAPLPVGGGGASATSPAAYKRQCGEDNPLWLILRACEEDRDNLHPKEEAQKAGSADGSAAG